MSRRPSRLLFLGLLPVDRSCKLTNMDQTCLLQSVGLFDSLSLFKLNNFKLGKTLPSFLILTPLLCRGSFCVHHPQILLQVDSVCSVGDFPLLIVALENFLDF